ncbi:MAG: hypothetical protein WA058_01755 [Minisyncoccia bacterium]
MKNNLLSAGILAFGLIASSLIMANGAFAQTALPTIQFPVAELGNCKDKDACKAYCDDPKHIDACVSFAEKNSLMSSNQLAEAKQVQTAIAKGVKPPACNGKKECDAYCEDPSHMKECIAFGEASGFLKGKELEDAKKMVAAIDKGVIPPACKGKEACDAYCSDRTHIEVCMTFAQAAGLMTPEEAQNSEKMMAAIKKGFMPPNCSGKEACDAYCAEPAHTDECINFSIAAGFMTEKEAGMAKKTGGKGPGGCVGKDACDTFCNTPDNQQTCMNFAKDNGMISAEEAQRMQEGQQKFKESMQNLPTEVADCMKTTLGADSFEKIKGGQAMPPKDMPDKVDSCFSKAPPVQRGPGEGGNIPPAGDGVQGKISPQGEQTPGTLFVPRIEQGQPAQMPPDGQRPPEGQFSPGSYPNQPPPGGQQAPGTLFVPRIEQNNQTPPSEGTIDSNPNQPTQFAPGTQSVAPLQGGTAPAPLPPPTSSTASGAGGGMAPGVAVPQIQQAQPVEQTAPAPAPIERTAPQSSNFNLNSTLASVITAFQEFKF